jgi:hypothetical protein
MLVHHSSAATHQVPPLRCWLLALLLMPLIFPPLARVLLPEQVSQEASLLVWQVQALPSLARPPQAAHSAQGVAGQEASHEESEAARLGVVAEGHQPSLPGALPAEPQEAGVEAQQAYSALLAQVPSPPRMLRQQAARPHDPERPASCARRSGAAAHRYR